MKNTKFMAVQLLLSDARGQYIPRDFVQGFYLTKFTGLSAYDVENCQNPDNEGYWDSWAQICDSARHTDKNGNVFTLHQDGDLWFICFDKMTDEEKRNFEFEVGSE